MKNFIHTTFYFYCNFHLLHLLDSLSDFIFTCPLANFYVGPEVKCMLLFYDMHVDFMLVCSPVELFTN